MIINDNIFNIDININNSFSFEMPIKNLYYIFEIKFGFCKAFYFCKNLKIIRLYIANKKF